MSSTDRDEPPVITPVITGVRAVIGIPTASDLVSRAGDRTRVDMVLHCGLNVDLQRSDRVTDLVLGDVYEVTWVYKRKALGIGYTRAGLKHVVGVAGT